MLNLSTLWPRMWRVIFLYAYCLIQLKGNKKPGEISAGKGTDLDHVLFRLLKYLNEVSQWLVEGNFIHNLDTAKSKCP